MGVYAWEDCLALNAGFEGRYTKKAGKTAEGSATFFRTDRYRAVALKEMKLNELFADIMANPAANAIHSQFLPFLQSSPNLVQALSRVSISFHCHRYNRDFVEAPQIVLHRQMPCMLLMCHAKVMVLIWESGPERAWKPFLRAHLKRCCLREACCVSCKLLVFRRSQQLHS